MPALSNPAVADLNADGHRDVVLVVEIGGDLAQRHRPAVFALGEDRDLVEGVVSTAEASDQADRAKPPNLIYQLIESML